MDKKFEKQDLDIYRKIVLSQIPRLLSFGDRDRESPTYGCFDRNYWHYKILDLSNSRYQEICLLLALLYKNDFLDNKLYNKTIILNWVKAAMKFWEYIQHRNGSFDEVYPNESSFIATAFTASAVTESILELDLDLLDHSTLVQSADWLMLNDNKEVSNQRAASINALYNVYLISGRTLYKDIAEKRLGELISSQTEEGYYPEYGGGDIGYQSIALQYLKKYSDKSSSVQLSESIQNAEKYILSRIDANANFDYSKTSRNTQYIYPSALLGTEGLQKQINGLSKDLTINPAWMDDRFCLPLTINYLEVYLSCL